MKAFIRILIVIAVLVALFIIAGPLYIINEGEQAVIIRFGQIISEKRSAGLQFKTPFVDNAVRYSKRILSWDADPRRVPTAENQFIWVDTSARWLIEDPTLFYSSVTTMVQAYSRLDDIIESAVRTTIADNELSEAVRNSNIINDIDRSATAATPEGDEYAGLEEIQNLLVSTEKQPEISKGRRKLSQEILASASRATPDFGIKLIDIVIRQIRYSDDLTESVYNRMISERNQIAEAYRSYGQGRKQQLLGQLENDKRSIISRAYETSESIRGTADAEASAIYANAYNQNQAFFEFWRAIESYKKTLPKFKKTLTTEPDYFNFLYNENGR